MPSVTTEPPKRPFDPQFGEDVKPAGSKPQMGESPSPSDPLDPATEAVLKDKDRPSPPPIVPDDERE
jgi:hypothetical protein